MVLPAFAKQGSVATTASFQVYAPRLFDNDAHRDVLPGLPTDRWSLFLSTDHGVGGIYRLDNDDITAHGSWSSIGSPVLSISSFETPQPLFDPVANRGLLYGHGSGSAATYGSQSTKVYSSNTFASGSFTYEAETFPYGHHTGYAQVRYADALFKAYHMLNGGETFCNGYSSGVDGETFALQGVWHPSPQHVCGQGMTFQGSPYTFQHGGQWYWLSILSTLPRLPGYPANVTALVAVPIVSDTDFRPVGGYQTLLTPSVSSSDPDYRIKNGFDIVSDGGTLYLYYVGVDGSSQNHICCATSTVGDSPTTSPIWAPTLTGGIEQDETETVVLSWDAANDALPAGLTITANSGTNASSQSAGNYYELKTGSGSAQDLVIEVTDAVDVRDVETYEFSIDDLTLAQADEDDTHIEFGIVDSLDSPTRGFRVLFNTASTSEQNGRLLIYGGTGTPEVDTGSWFLPWCSVATNVAEWRRFTPLKLSIRVHDFGKRLTFMLDDTVGFHRDIETDGVDWDAEKPYFRLTTANSHPEHWARFSTVAVKTYGTAPEPAFPRDYTRRAKITIASAQVGTGGVADFSVLLTEASLPADLFTHARSDGGDIRFSLDEAGEKPLAFDLIDYDSGGAAKFRVGPMDLSDTIDSTLYVWCGAASEVLPAADSEFGQYAAYDSDWEGYWPTGGGTDRTIHGRNMTPTGTPTTISVPTGNATDYDSGDYSNSTLAVALTPTPLTMLCWRKLDATSGERIAMTLSGGSSTKYATLGSNASRGYEFVLRESGSFDSTDFAVANGGTLDTNWHQVAGTSNSTNSHKIYVDASLVDTDVNSITMSAYGAVRLAVARANNNYLIGQLYEASIHSAERPQAWVTTEYNQVSSPSSFATAGALEEVGGGFNPAWVRGSNILIGA